MKRQLTNRTAYATRPKANLRNKSFTRRYVASNELLAVFILAVCIIYSPATQAMDKSDMKDIAINITAIQSGADRLNELHEQISNARHDFDIGHYHIIAPLHENAVRAYDYTTSVIVDDVYFFRVYAHSDNHPYILAFDGTGIVYLLHGFESNDFNFLAHRVFGNQLTSQQAIEYAILYLETVDYNYYNSAEIHTEDDVSELAPQVEFASNSIKVTVYSHEVDIENGQNLDKVLFRHDFTFDDNAQLIQYQKVKTTPLKK